MTTSITVALASPAAHAEVIELASARLQHLTRAEVAWPFESPEVFTHLVVAVARDDDEHLLGIGLSLRPTFAPPDRSMLRVVVARDHEGRGVGSALRRFLLPHVPDTTRRLGGVLPWDHLDSGLDKDWLWKDWQDSVSEFEQDDCRWTPCFDCGVCPSMDTEIQIGPTGRKLLPLTPVAGLRVPA